MQLDDIQVRNVIKRHVTDVTLTSFDTDANIVTSDIMLNIIHKCSSQLYFLFLLNHIESTKNIMSAEIFDRKRRDKNAYWHSELRSLGAEPSSKTEPGDDNEELGKLPESLKQTMYQEYKVAYGSDNDNKAFSHGRKKPLSEIVKEGSFKE